jgi:hypothetical protein
MPPNKSLSTRSLSANLFPALAGKKFPKQATIAQFEVILLCLVAIIVSRGRWNFLF